MLKKSLISLAVAASVAGISGCDISSTTGNDKVNTTPLEIGTPEYNEANNLGSVYPVFNPAKELPTGLRQAPVTLDLLFQGDPDEDGTDGTIPLAQGNPGLADEGYNPIFSAAADLDGFSTTAQMDIPFSAPIDPDSVIGSGADATVFLLELSYGGEDPLLSEATPSPVGLAPIDASVITLANAENETDPAFGAGNVLRISPTEPLKPATRYVIVLTNGIKDTSGLSVTGSPTYKLLSTNGDVFTDPSLAQQAALQGAINGYEALASGFFAAPGVPYDYEDSDIVFSFSMTTGGTTAVLDSMAAPANFVEGAVPGSGEAFNITLPSQFRYIVEEHVDAQRDTSGNLDAAGVTAAVGAIFTDPDFAGILPNLGDNAGEQQQTIGGIVSIHNAIPSPAPRLSDFSSTIDEAGDDGAGDALNLDTLLGVPATGGTGKVANGTIKVPYYGGIPNLGLSPATAAFVLNKWDADNSLEADLGDVLDGAGVSSENQAKFTPPSTNVTRLFPIAKPQGFLEIPVSVVYSTACGGDYTPVIFQHGITSNRSSSFGVAAQMFAANPCYATVAIDLPMHGLTNEDDAGLLALLSAESQSDQRHFGLTINPETLEPAAMTGTDDQSGSLFIQLLSFQGTRDNMRQAIMDMMNLNASLEFMDFTDENAGTDFDVSKVHFVGHSLGAILGTGFVAVNNTIGSEAYSNGCTTCNLTLPKVTTATLANGGGQVTKLLENSNIGTSLVIPGLAALGSEAELDLSQGSSLYELTLNLFQATVDSADPLNFVEKFNATNTPVLAFEIAGNNDNPSDQTVPVDAVENRLEPALPAPLAGTEPLAAALELSGTSADITGTDPVKALVRFNNGVHSSFAGISNDGEAGSPTTVFNEMMVQLRSFIASDGVSLDVNDTNVVVPSAE
ncbi:Ig-like domain-containing protein [Bermanella sp. R86510]|uniref:Ig-like domain-containing protein n=1 Tax=unclassified Bermanella TaxID=2627862 RepID=UPI0037C5610E